jgi:hypothetical protein
MGNGIDCCSTGEVPATPLIGVSDAALRFVVNKAEQAGSERSVSVSKAGGAPKKRERTLKPLKEGHNRCSACNRAIKQPQTIGPVCKRKQDAAAARAESKELSNIDSQ